ncbi:unnamed protein product [Mytilus coruscus]|uniref:Uncharacterized protein n=1 Tax=Mytilus coruscus TaxID=42192 RepID=A0A6J8CEC0_MYTCO|nr:unnamed protein product [Mytilus coruscus]
MRYYKSLKVKKHQNTNNLNETIDLKETIQSNKERIEYSENENMRLQDEINDFKMSFELNQIVQTFHNGKYNDSVREVYAALLTLNVGVNNVEKVVRTVLEKLEGLKVERLPNRTFSEIMLVEAKAHAQMQAAEAMLTSDFNTLHTDGTKRGGHEFGEKQLSDCLPGGIFNENTDDVHKDMRVESRTVSTTNIVADRDFANLDRLRSEKPNANTIALEGIILYSNNKTLKWLDSISVEKKAEVFKIARENSRNYKTI